MAANGGASTTAGTGPDGVQTFITTNKRWRISTRKQPILKAEPIEALSNDLGIPIPEMIFGDNYVAIEDVETGWTIEFNAKDALDRVSKTEEGMLQVAVAEEWKKERSHQEEVKQVVKPFDWSYSTDYKGTTHEGLAKGDWVESSQEKDPVRTDLLSRQDPILFFDSVDLYEDELADNGIALFSIKVRVMPERLLLLARFFLRLDGVVVRIRDTRVYIEHATHKVIRHYTAKEEKYEVVQEKLKSMRGSVPELLRDANKLAPLLQTVEDKTDVFEVVGES
ncbi:TIP41-like protein [Teratosphaeria destructans]|uniref:TIP41-like protein n=1 Tax=Teratosphaeria destructans TaxID=418781 RepID=A0A9W7SN20_9PEZI|nr:TIP41-like protein [Teratosphaeria destructans]